ncbi:hypothetical protein NL676_016249 [Syzygium grande]|nr:hypothetical protein NL676_016249 [Syzygium grande]
MNEKRSCRDDVAAAPARATLPYFLLSGSCCLNQSSSSQATLSPPSLLCVIHKYTVFAEPWPPPPPPPQPTSRSPCIALLLFLLLLIPVSFSVPISSRSGPRLPAGSP